MILLLVTCCYLWLRHPLFSPYFIRKEEGKSFTMEAAMAKWYASVVAQKASGAAIEWAGGVGFTRETGIEKFWRDSKIVRASSPPSLSTLS